MVIKIKSIRIDYEDYYLIDGMLRAYGFYKYRRGLYKLHEIVAFEYYDHTFSRLYSIICEVSEVYFTRQGMPIYKFVRYKELTRTQEYQRFKNDRFKTNIYN